MTEATTAPTIRPLGQPGDLGWVVQAHGEIYAREFGWDSTFEALVLQIVADFAAGHDPAREAAWIAESAGRRVGCVFCVAGDASTARLRILLVDPAARGQGVGARLLDRCLEFARAAGCRVVLIPGGSRTREELSELAPDAFLDSISELPAWLRG